MNSPFQLSVYSVYSVVKKIGAQASVPSLRASVVKIPFPA